MRFLTDSAGFCLWILVSAVFVPALRAQTFQVKAEEFVDSYSKSGGFRGVVLVARNGQILFHKGYGNAIEAWEIPNGPNTKFELASLTKQFTGAAILLLAQAGRINLEDAVTKFFPNAPQSWRQITIKQLVTHTSGIPNNEIRDFNKGICVAYTEDELLATFKDRPLKFKPGTDWAYTNTEYYLLAYIIQSVSGQRYADFLTQEVFKPLGMSSSGFVSTLAIVPQMAEGYTRDGGSLRRRDYFDRSLEIGAGGVYSTTVDLLRWNEALSENKLLNQKSSDLMFSPSSPGNYGFGWFIEKAPRNKAYHEGSDPGFSAFEIRFPEERALVIVLSNLENAPVRLIANGLGEMLLSGKTPSNQK